MKLKCTGCGKIVEKTYMEGGELREFELCWKCVPEDRKPLYLAQRAEAMPFWIFPLIILGSICAALTFMWVLLNLGGLAG